MSNVIFQLSTNVKFVFAHESVSFFNLLKETQELAHKTRSLLKAKPLFPIKCEGGDLKMMLAYKYLVVLTDGEQVMTKI